MSSQAEPPAEDRPKQCERIIAQHALAGAAVGLIPVPYLDLAGLMAVQLNMLRALSGVYEVPFVEECGRSILAALAGGLVPLSSASLIKAIPLLGPALGGVGATVLSGASTYAVGRVFVQHFESGGTFLTLDPREVRAHYQRELERAEAQLREQGLRRP